MTARPSLLVSLEAAAQEGLAPNIERFLAFLGWTEGEVFELQALHVPDGRWTQSKAAHGASLAELIALAEQADRWKAQGIYALFNRIDPGVQHRRGPGAWHVVPKGEGTTDKDVLGRRALYFDFDPQRTRGISATADELGAAAARAVDARALLAQLVPEASIGAGLSGNGLALFLALEEHAPDPEVEALIKTVLLLVAAKLDDGAVKVDASVADPKRLCPAFGTLKRKGAHSADRPHRRSAFLAPEQPHRLRLEELRALVAGLRQRLSPEQLAKVDQATSRGPARAASTPSAPRADSASRSAPAGASPAGASPAHTSPSGPGDVAQAFRIANEIPVREVLARLGLLEGEQPTCPGCGEADGGVAVVKNGLKCSHNRCAQRGFREGFRTVVDLVMEREQLDKGPALAWLREHFPTAGIPDRPPPSRAAAAAAAPAPAPAPVAGAAAPPAPPAPPPPPASSAPAPAAPAPPPRRKDGKPLIRLGNDLEENVSQGVAALASRADLFTRGLELTQIVPIVDPSGVAKIVLRPLPKASLHEMLCTAAAWERYNPRGGEGPSAWAPTMPTDAIVKAVDARGRWPGLRPIVGIARTPFLRSDGTVCDRPGYDPASRYVLDGHDTWPALPTHPGLDDARAALAQLVDLFCDFPLVDEASRYVPVAALLTLLAMPGLEGANVPAFLIEANTPGTGKTLMLDVVSLLATGQVAPRTEWAENEEMGKVLGSAALEGASLLAFDNLSNKIPFGGAALEMVLTCSGQYKPRILGRSETPTLPWRAVILGTGNNILIAGDTRRRVLLCRQQTELEKPEERDGFKYPHLKRHVLAHRKELLVAALTLLRAHALAGRPSELRRMGSFEEWASVVPSAIVWAGGANVLEAMPRAETSEDPQLAALLVLLEAWAKLSGGLPLRLGTLADRLYPRRSSSGSGSSFDDDPDPEDAWGHVREALELLAPVKGGGHVRFDPKRLGYVLRAHRNRNLGGRAFRDGPTHHGAKTWMVVDLTPPPGPPGPPGPPSSVPPSSTSGPPSVPPSSPSTPLAPPSDGGSAPTMGEVPPPSPIPAPAERPWNGGSGGSGGSFSNLTGAQAHAPTQALARAPGTGAPELNSHSSPVRLKSSPTSPTSPISAELPGPKDGGSQNPLPPLPPSAWQETFEAALAAGYSEDEAAQLADLEAPSLPQECPDV